MRCGAGRDLCGAPKKDAFLAAVMAIGSVNGVNSAHLTKSLAPLICGSEDAEIEIDFRHAKCVGVSLVYGGADLLVFVTSWVNRETLYILEYETIHLGRFG